ncbi:MAG TPA: PPC domain-containing protein, partial [Gemmataceae bacterium]|nr:PPC domain-containing protein [Gemmataceae bacterium]
GMLPEVTDKEPNDDFKKPQVLNGSSLTVNGKLEKNGDVDCFAVTLKKGQTLVASLEANRTLRSPMDGVLQIISADGFVLEENNDFHGLDPQLAFEVPKDGTYVVRVFAFPATPDSSIRFAGAETYLYRLTLTTGGFADHAFPMAAQRDKPGSVEALGWNIPAGTTVAVPKGGEFATLVSPAFATSVRVRLEPHPVLKSVTPETSPPFSAAGRVEKPGAIAAFRFAAKKGKALSVQVQSREYSLALSPVVVVRDAEGKQLARAEPPALGSDTALSFTPAADGVFAVEVSDLFAGGGRRHAFLLRVVPVEPDYELTVAADRFTLAPGKPTTIPVKVVRKNGFAKPVEVVAEGLPEGVKLQVVPPAGKPDPALMNVSLSAEKPVSPGAFRLAGRVKDEPALGRAARFVPAPADGGAPTNHLWLTVLPTPGK